MKRAGRLFEQAADGSAWEDAGSNRAGRGGSWNIVAGYARAAERFYDAPASR